MKSLFAALAALALSSCASLSRDGGAGEVERIVGERAPAALAATDETTARTLVRERLADALSQADAVAIALANNPRLRASYQDLRISEADLVQATRLRNPGFTFGRFRQGDEREIERKVTLDVAGLITMPWRIEAEKSLHAAAQNRAAQEIVRIADETRRAWVEAVAAEQSVRYAAQVADAAEASADIAGQMLRAGNFSKLDQSREQLFHSEAVTRLARSQQASVVARERLGRLMGLSGREELAFRLPDRLPDLPATPRELNDAEATALAQRLDVHEARAETEGLARSLGLARVNHFVNVLDLTYENDSRGVLPRRSGYEVELSLPIFDWGDARAAKAQATYMRSLHRTAETAIRARSEVRETYASYRNLYDVARRYRDEIVPLRKRISEENLLRYNGMLISVFELLADAREQAAAVIATIEATRDFWIAEANLETALTTGTPGSAADAGTSASAEPTAD